MIRRLCRKLLAPFVAPETGRSLHVAFTCPRCSTNSAIMAHLTAGESPRTRCHACGVGLVLREENQEWVARLDSKPAST